MAKKSPKNTHKNKLSKHQIVVLAGLILVLTLILSFAIYTVYPRYISQQRLDKINNIYASVKLDTAHCYQSRSNVFGDKRPYSWDKGRSWASEIDYVCNTNVSDTVAMIKKAVSATDFTFYQEPYPGTTSWEFIYKSPRNEYIRISASSKTRDDATSNELIATGKNTAATLNIDPGTAPTNVIFKVNIDDNNE